MDDLFHFFAPKVENHALDKKLEFLEPEIPYDEDSDNSSKVRSIEYLRKSNFRALYVNP